MRGWGFRRTLGLSAPARSATVARGGLAPRGQRQPSIVWGRKRKKKKKKRSRHCRPSSGVATWPRAFKRAVAESSKLPEAVVSATQVGNTDPGLGQATTEQLPCRQYPGFDGTKQPFTKPGIAKSAIARNIAEKMGFAYKDIRLAMVDETDVG